jgi:hypothetical protein
MDTTHWTPDPSIYAPGPNPGPDHDVEQDSLASQICENMNASWQSLASDHRILGDSWQLTPPFATSAAIQGYPLSPSHESNLRSTFHGTSLCLKRGHGFYTQKQDAHTPLLPLSATINYGLLVPLLNSRSSSVMVLCQLRVEVAPHFLVDLEVCIHRYIYLWGQRASMIE